jgi:hypothetical protein
MRSRIVESIHIIVIGTPSNVQTPFSGMKLRRLPQIEISRSGASSCLDGIA